MFTNQTVTSLDLGANNLSDKGVSKLSRVLSNQPSMKNLDLRGNAITGLGALMLAKNIAQYQIGIIKGRYYKIISHIPLPYSDSVNTTAIFNRNYTNIL